MYVIYLVYKIRLQGHTDIAAYALEWNANEPLIASGGRDKQILLWNVD